MKKISERIELTNEELVVNGEKIDPACKRDCKHVASWTGPLLEQYSCGAVTYSSWVNPFA